MVTRPEAGMTKRRVLLVEDNPDDQELALRALRRPEILADVVVAADGVEAVDYLSDIGQVLPALVLLDLKLPRLDGFDVLRRTRAHGRTAFVPVVMFTSSGERADIVRCYELQCNGYVQKPVDSATFSATIRDIISYWLCRNEVVTV